MNTLFVQQPPAEVLWALVFFVSALVTSGASDGYQRDGRRVAQYLMDWITPICVLVGVFTLFLWISRLAKFI